VRGDGQGQGAPQVSRCAREVPLACVGVRQAHAYGVGVVLTDLAAGPCSLFAGANRKFVTVPWRRLERERRQAPKSEVGERGTSHDSLLPRLGPQSQSGSSSSSTRISSDTTRVPTLPQARAGA
jgi:hypothetical protein